MPNLVGTTLGQYELVATIGSGGMATVYKGYQPSLDRYVAVKVLAGQLAQDSTGRKRFLQEAKAVASLSHPNIVPVYDFGEQDAMLYIVTELVESGTLKDRLDELLEPAVAARLANEIAQALDYAHRQGIVHRDVKPANILLALDGRALLSDFGVAKMVAGTQHTQTGTSVGTPAYMSPEQAKGEDIDGRSDIYSLGIVLFEMLTGRTPFRGDTPISILHQQLSAPPPPPRKLNHHIPRRLEKVLLKALSKEPGDRYRTAREMAWALQRAVKFKPLEELPGAQADEALTVAVTPTPAATAERFVTAARRGAARVGQGALRGLGGLAKLSLRVLVVLLIAVLVITIVAAVGGAFALGSFAERTIPSYTQDLSEFTAYGKTIVMNEAEMNAEVGTAIEPFALGTIKEVTIDFVPPESVELSANLLGASVRLEGRLELQDGILRVYVERLNNTPLYLVGGLISNGVNRGIDELFTSADFRLDQLEVRTTAVAIRSEGSAVVPAPTSTPAATPTLRPSPTARPTSIPTGVLTVTNEIGVPLTIELADEEWELGPGDTLELELPVDSYPYAYTVHADGYKGGQGTVRVVEGNTIFRLSAQSEAQTTPPPMPSPTKKASETKPPPGATPVPEVTPTQRPNCPNSRARISAPGVDVPVTGRVTIRGTANIPDFDYYKLELGTGSRPNTWVTLGDLYRSPVVDDDLGFWDSASRPQGVYVLRLTVVDRTGNYQTCDVRVNVTR